MSDRVIIEVGLNENQDRRANRHVPYSAAELAADARRCYEAGAAIVHYHGRGPAGEPALSDPSLNLAAQRRITEATPLIAYPSYGAEVRVLDYYDIGTPAPQRYQHVSETVRGGVRVEVAPVDLGVFDSNARWDTQAGRLAPSTGLLMNTGSDHRWILDFCRRNGIKPHFNVFDTIHLQNLLNLIHWNWAGSPPLVVKLFLAGRSATPSTLLFYHQRLRELFAGVELIWMPLVYGTDQFPLCTLALAFGGHVRIGIGDHHYREHGEPTNAALVEQMVTVARAIGREPATPDEARAQMGLATRRAAPSTRSAQGPGTPPPGSVPRSY
ncbi:MAG: 3-keto-5-aminohexanoate cleavage protein [Candidatus Binatia bacterium]